jgi:hypothetical protein
LTGADLNFRFNWLQFTDPCRRLHWNLDSFFGAKYMGLDEGLSITENITVLPGQDPDLPPPGTQFFVQDRFNTRNRFIGGNMGLIGELRMGRVFLELHTGLALGMNRQTVVIGGNTQVTLASGIVSPLLTGGLLAQPTNIGNYNRNQFSYISEFGLKLGFQVTDHFRLYAGYDLMYWSNVVRPGQQIDYNVNASQLPSVDPTTGQPLPYTINGTRRPAFDYKTSDLWISGFNAGLQWVF